MEKIDLNDFQWLEYTPAILQNRPEIYIRPDKIMFNAVSLKTIGSPLFIKLLFDEKGRRIAIQGVKKASGQTINILPARQGNKFGIYQIERVKFIRGLMPQWGDTSRFKVPGVHYADENIVAYDLKAAETYKIRRGGL